MTLYRKFNLASGMSALAYLVASSASAQTLLPPEGEEDQAIVVTGTRPIAESESTALTIQKNSDSLVTVVAADGVGRLPDQNIAQATSRLPASRSSAIRARHATSRCVVPQITGRRCRSTGSTSSARKAATRGSIPSPPRSRRRSSCPRR